MVGTHSTHSIEHTTSKVSSPHITHTAHAPHRAALFRMPKKQKRKKPQALHMYWNLQGQCDRTAK